MDRMWRGVIVADIYDASVDSARKQPSHGLFTAEDAEDCTPVELFAQDFEPRRTQRTQRKKIEWVTWREDPSRRAAKHSVPPVSSVVKQLTSSAFSAVPNNASVVELRTQHPGAFDTAAWRRS